VNWIKEIAQEEDGSALATVLVIAVIISLFIGAILSGIVLQSRFIQRDINSSKALYAAEEAAFRFLHLSSVPASYSSTKTIPLTNRNEARVTATPFGGFWEIQSVAKVSNQKRTIRMLFGRHSSLLFNNSIALGDSNSALTLTGTTEIKGDIITYSAGVRTENFKGIPFRGVVEGERTRFNKEIQFPEFNTSFFKLQEEYFESLYDDRSLQRFASDYIGQNPSSSIQQKDTLYFEQNTEWITNQVVQLPMDVVLVVNGNFTINGEYSLSPFTKIIVRDTLLVGGAVSGKNILLYAGKSLQIGGGASVSAQALSKGTITIRDDAYLRYPSLVYSSKELYDGGKKEVINIRDRSIVDGTVIYPFKSSSFTQDLFRVKVDTNATVRGSIYNAGQTELLGTVLGSVITEQFYFYESPTSYINWLKDVTIDVTQRPQNFVLPIGFTDSTNYAILDWYELEE